MNKEEFLKKLIWGETFFIKEEKENLRVIVKNSGMHYLASISDKEKIDSLRDEYESNKLSGKTQEEIALENKGLIESDPEVVIPVYIPAQAEDEGVLEFFPVKDKLSETEKEKLIKLALSIKGLTDDDKPFSNEVSKESHMKMDAIYLLAEELINLLADK